MESIYILFDVRVASVFIGILLPLILYWYSKKNHDYWKKRGIPFVKPYPFVGNSMEVFRKNLEDIELERYKQCGRIYGYYEASKPLISVGEPELLKKIFVKDFQYFTTRRIFNTGNPIIDKMLSMLRGEDWKRVRTIISPTFSTGKIKRVVSIFEDCAKTLVQNFKLASAEGDSVDVLKLYGAFTMDVIASSAFSTKLDSHNDPENEFVRRAKSAFSLKLSFKFLLVMLWNKLLRKLRLRGSSSEHVDFFKRVTLEIMEERKKTGQTRNDFLQLMMDTAKEVSKEEKWEDDSEDIIANYGDESTDHPVLKTASFKHLSLDELVAQCVIFFLGGFHTTSTTLAVLTYLLALNPEVQVKLFTEIKETLCETNGKLTYESIQKMKYLDNVISETLRMFSPVVKLDRTADADYKLGDTGITIPKGMPVSIPIFAMHNDPKLFPEPEKFNPERFYPEEREKQIPYSYLPFGTGPRNCVAMRFALMELKVCLVHVLSIYLPKKCSDTQIPLEFQRATVVLQPKSIHLRMEPSKDCPLKS